MARAPFAQPVRGRCVAWMMSRPGSACNSTSSGSCARSKRTPGDQHGQSAAVASERERQEADRAEPEGDESDAERVDVLEESSEVHVTHRRQAREGEREEEAGQLPAVQ
jgi:hypothetical protein